MSEFVVLGMFDNPVFQSELMFLFAVAMLFGLIGLLGKSETLALFGPFLFFEHVVMAVGTDIPELNTANWVVVTLLVLYMAWRMVGDAFLGSEGA